MYYHFPNFVIIHGVSPFADYHSINEIRAFTQFFVFLFLFSLQRRHLLLIITFKAKRLKSKIDFSKKEEIFTIQFTLEFVMKQWQQEWWSQEWTNSGCFKKGYSLHESIYQVILLVDAQSLCASQMVKDDISGCKVQYWICDPTISSWLLDFPGRLSQGISYWWWVFVMKGFSSEVGLNSPKKFGCVSISPLCLRLVSQSLVGMLLLKSCFLC